MAAEVVWFEPRGIECTICVPLRTEDRPVGIMFFDFDSQITEGEIDLAFLTDVGRRCARALGRSPSPRPDARSTDPQAAALVE